MPKKQKQKQKQNKTVQYREKNLQKDIVVLLYVCYLK